MSLIPRECKDYDEYIVFLFGSDDFNVCKLLREKSKELGSDTIYEMAVYLAHKFQKFDRDCNFTKSQYENFEDFLSLYEKEIINYIMNDIEFEVKQVGGNL